MQSDVRREPWKAVIRIRMFDRIRSGRPSAMTSCLVLNLCSCADDDMEALLAWVPENNVILTALRF